MATKKKNIWVVYLLVSERGRTYVGCTTNVSRRLRQHNKELVGGARATSKETGWKIVSYIIGFADRSEACRWEALVKKRARGLDKRSHAMYLVSGGMCPAGRTNYIPPKGLKLIEVQDEISR